MYVCAHKAWTWWHKGTSSIPLGVPEYMWCGCFLCVEENPTYSSAACGCKGVRRGVRGGWWRGIWRMRVLCIYDGFPCAICKMWIILICLRCSSWFWNAWSYRVFIQFVFVWGSSLHLLLFCLYRIYDKTKTVNINNIQCECGRKCAYYSEHHFHSLYRTLPIHLHIFSLTVWFSFLSLQLWGFSCHLFLFCLFKMPVHVTYSR